MTPTGTEKWRVNPAGAIPAPLAAESVIFGFVTVKEATALVTEPAMFDTTTV